MQFGSSIVTSSAIALPVLRRTYTFFPGFSILHSTPEGSSFWRGMRELRSRAFSVSRFARSAASAERCDASALARSQRSPRNETKVAPTEITMPMSAMTVLMLMVVTLMGVA